MFLELCFEITQNLQRCKEFSNPPAIVEEEPIRSCPFIDAYSCAGFYDRLTNTLYVRPYVDSTFRKAILLHEACHWLDDFGGCGCDPYEVQRRYLFKNGSYLDWLAYIGRYHDAKRTCTYDESYLLRTFNGTRKAGDSR
jgi:hypothetical protein